MMKRTLRSQMFPRTTMPLHNRIHQKNWFKMRNWTVSSSPSTIRTVAKRSTLESSSKHQATQRSKIKTASLRSWTSSSISTLIRVRVPHMCNSSRKLRPILQLRWATLRRNWIVIRYSGTSSASLWRKGQGQHATRGEASTRTLHITLRRTTHQSQRRRPASSDSSSTQTSRRTWMMTSRRSSSSSSTISTRSRLQGKACPRSNSSRSARTNQRVDRNRHTIDMTPLSISITIRLRCKTSSTESSAHRSKWTRSTQSNRIEDQ